MEVSVMETSKERGKGGIVFIRHGEGEHNVEHIYNSNPENPGYKAVKLTDHGREQVRETSDQLLDGGINGDNVCKVIVSPLPRTIETADIVMGKLQIARFLREIDPRVIEQNAGERDGQDYLQYKDPDFWFPEHPKRYGGETRLEIRDRMESLILSIVNDRNCDLSKQYVIVVSHGSPLLLAQQFMGMGDERLKTAGYRIIPYSQVQKVMGNDVLHRDAS
ncbi:histidine phosphatase family protein [Endozoicomonas elysicola]|uniref:Phosphoglycerate mutase n=1 Tax=Endozoicomonas elysicola TaxID=305900 RepID=A0A081K8E5_9GAMM|nr:histidine phosphatase family protein [Endozoicomonas elysicola]KEI70421.1 hypothetical protein GV64_06445 [Endozoicomonas elysicola]